MYARQISNEHTKQTKELSRIMCDNSKKKSDAIFYAINSVSAILLIWLLASYLDIVSHNMSTYTYAWWNIIALFL